MRAALLSLILLAPTPGLAATFISGGTATGTNATVGNASDPKSDSDAATGPTSSVSSSSTSTIVNADGNATAQSTATGTWTSANSGTAGMTWGWSGQTNASTSYSTGNVGSNWTYTFQTGSVASQFIANWIFNVGGAGSSFGLQGVYGTGSSPFDVTPINVAPTGTSSGNFTVNLAANTIYTFGFRNNGNVSGGPSTRDTNGDFRMDWRITGGAVPEPATWAMLILGFGLIGSALRQRQSATVRVRFQTA